MRDSRTSLRQAELSITQNATVQRLTYLTIAYLPVALMAVSSPPPSPTLELPVQQKKKKPNPKPAIVHFRHPRRTGCALPRNGQALVRRRHYHLVVGHIHHGDLCAEYSQLLPVSATHGQ